MEIEKLKYGSDYKGPLTANVDWVAGGNFDGYIYRVHLRFLKEGNSVIKSIKIVDDSHFDDEVSTSEIHGTFSETGKGTITCVFPNFEMRGKILGENNQYIAFSVFIPQSSQDVTECYEMP